MSPLFNSNMKYAPKKYDQSIKQKIKRFITRNYQGYRHYNSTDNYDHKKNKFNNLVNFIFHTSPQNTSLGCASSYNACCNIVCFIETLSLLTAKRSALF